MNGLRQGQASRPQVEAKCAMEVPRWMNMAESVANLLSVLPMHGKSGVTVQERGVESHDWTRRRRSVYHARLP
jgi:hypothetical protein